MKFCDIATDFDLQYFLISGICDFSINVFMLYFSLRHQLTQTSAQYPRDNPLLSLRSPHQPSETTTLGASLAPTTDFSYRHRLRPTRPRLLPSLPSRLHIPPMGARIENRNPRRCRRTTTFRTRADPNRRKRGRERPRENHQCCEGC